MRLLPVGDTWQRHFVGQLVVADLHPHGAEADFFGSITDAKQRNALAGDVAVHAQQGLVVLLAMVLAYHMQTGRAAVAGIELFCDRKHQYIVNNSLIFK
jgi:hypothetical protein